MEYLEGETLSDRLVKGPLSLDQTLRYGIEISEALDKAHRQGIVHRDLKPGNVMLTKTGVKLLDFGLAKVAAPAADRAALTSLPTAMGGPNLTQEGTILGTFQYMAPEQLEGKEADARTDIFAFGTVLYEMATGRKAFTGATQASLISTILRDDPPPISQVQTMSPPALDRVVKTCMAKDPEERWQSAGDVGKELKWISEGSAAGVAAPVAVATKRRSRQRLAWAIAAAAVAASVLLALYVLRRPAPQGPHLVSSVLLPPGLQLDEYDRALALSPDGTRLAISGTGAGGGTQIWMRSLSSGDVRPIPGTEDGTYPFWSPDGKNLGFFAAHTLKKLDLGSGAISAICSATEGRGGAWAPDGNIVFAPAPVGPLFRVSSGGGEPVAVTKIERPGDSHRLPVLLPGGQKYIYVFGGNDTVVAKLRLLDLASGRDMPFSNENSDVVFVKPGYLLFRRGRTLMAQPIDSGSARLTGSPATVGEQVSFYLGRYAGQFTASDTGLLLYEPQQVQTMSQLTWFDADGNRLGTLGEPRAFETAGIAISHDGRSVLASIRDPSQRPDVWLFDVGRGSGRRFSFDEAGGELPQWSYDDRVVAYETGNSEVRIKTLGEGGEPRKLSVGGDLGPFSPDGASVLIYPAGEGNTFGLAIFPLSGSGPARRIVASRVARVASAFSPDGKWVAYISDESGRDEVYVVAAAATGGKVQVSSNGAGAVWWLAKSGEIVYLEPATSRLFAVSVRVQGSNVEPGEPRALFGGRPIPADTGVDVTADGKKILLALPVADGRAQPLTLVTNWMSLLRKS